MSEAREIIIQSKKYGDKIILIDEEDFDKISKYKWMLRYDKGRSDKFYIITNIFDEVTLKRNTMSLHRFIMGFPKGLVVDHKDGNTLNNRKENLRACKHSENIMNSKKRSDGKTSKYKGVHFAKASNKFLAQIKINGETIYLGLFDKEIDGAIAYNKKAIELFGEFALLNEV